MAGSKTDIINSALVKLGLEPLLSDTDDSKRARFMRVQFDPVRKAELRDFPWNFATTRKPLAKSATYTPNFEFTNAFPLPTDVLRIVKTNLNLPSSADEVKWTIETDTTAGKKYLITSEGSVSIEYIKDMTVTGLFDSMFDELLAWRLAADLAYSLTNDKNLAQLMREQYIDFRQNARTVDSQEKYVQTVQADDFLAVRV